HIWQAELWRALLTDIPDRQRRHSRAFLHEQFLIELAEHKTRPIGLPRRIMVFGVSALPQQFIKALAALSRHCQVLVCIHNPCRHYWADIIEQKDLLRAERHRQQHKQGMPVALEDHELHLHANPLLAAWGKQGRDYIRLWDEYDQPEQYRDWFQRIDVFDDYGESGRRNLLQQVQQAILELTPLPGPKQPLVDVNPDNSLVFHIAHSLQREVEILHDQMLQLFTDAPDLTARDVIVMTPDIDSYAPHIHAVFGQIGVDDPRYIPFSIADQQERGRNSLLIAVETLLHLPESRFTVSDLLDLLETPALCNRFNISDQDLPLLQQWLQGAGIRWGLHAQHRHSLDLPAGLEQNTWEFGLRRMLLGYAVGDGEHWQAIEPYPEIGGLSAALLGPLTLLIKTLDEFWQQLQTPLPPEAWGQCLRNFLASFFAGEDDADTLTISKLLDSLERWQDNCSQAELSEALPLQIVREAWLNDLDQTNLAQRFMVGSVNFCTLMPMRAIPFQVICLLGMNDGDFPRSHPPLDFDLMSLAGNYRPGDRSRREDDRYLFLEALLSARQQLYISWIGRNSRDNSELPASVLVAQLRDYLQAGWCCAGQDLLTAITVTHLLQPFSAGYFQGQNSALFTYAHEWRAAFAALPQINPATPLPGMLLESSLTIAALTDFLRNPVKCFFNQRLKVYFDQDHTINEDSEPFHLNGLEKYQLADELLRQALTTPAEQVPQILQSVAEKQRRQGKLPMAGFAETAQHAYLDPALAAIENSVELLKAWPTPVGTLLDIQLTFHIDQQSIRLEDWLGGLRSNSQGQPALILPRPNAILQNQQPKWHTLISAWLNHLAACAQGLALHTFMVGADHSLAFPPIPAAQAVQFLQSIVDAWYHGLNQPLPLACKTGFAWLEKSTQEEDKAVAAAESCYIGNYNSSGEVAEDPYLARAYPNFADLYGAAFCHYAQELYAPLMNAVSINRQAGPPNQQELH
ncbi:MAG: exodeoxyribonuclease V subunit gamma, partial [Methylococcales bacterium]